MKRINYEGRGWMETKDQLPPMTDTELKRSEELLIIADGEMYMGCNHYE